MSEYENMTKTIVPSKLLYRFGGTLLWHAQLGSDFAVMVTKGSLVGVLVVQLRRTGVCQQQNAPYTPPCRVQYIVKESCTKVLKKSVGSLPTFHLCVLVSALPRGKINHLYKRGKGTVLKPVLIRIAMSFVGFADLLQVKIVPELSRTSWTSVWLYFSRCS